jgi:hypothetical protein
MHNVWLVRSPEYDVLKFEKVVNMLRSFKGVLNFYTLNEQTVEQSDDVPNNPITDLDAKPISWFFEKCNEFRRQQNRSSKEMVLLLTDIPNENNFFNGIDFETGLNLMVQTSEWNLYFPETDECFPVVYHVAASILIRKWFNSLSEAENQLNLMPKGCMMDFCRQKSDVKLKILTANISEIAIKSILDKKVDPNLLNQVLRIFEGVRHGILFKKYEELIKPDPLEITFEGDEKQIYFKEMSEPKFKLPSLNRAVYIFLLKESTAEVGFHPTDFGREKYKDSLFDIYNELFKNQVCLDMDGEEYIKRRNKVDTLYEAGNPKKWEQLISKTNKAFADFLGPDLAELYMIKGEPKSNKTIALDRTLVKGLKFFESRC